MNLIKVRRKPPLVDRMKAETTLARREIRQGRFQRSMALVTAFSALVSGFEAYIQHRRGAFKSRLMWTPVWLMPPVALAALAAVFSERTARRLVPVLALASLVDGILGFFYHVRGIQRMPGRFRVGQYNIVMGPPIFAPLLMCSVGVTGILTGLLRREARDLGGESTAPVQPPGQSSTWRDLLTRQVARGEFQRTMAIITAVFGVLAGGEAYVEHLRGSFNQRVMWTPVWITPVMVCAAVGAVLSEKVARRILPAASIVTFLDGLVGFALHLRGIQRMAGGFGNIRFNITMGPPLFAPLLFSSVGLLGFIASLLRRRIDRAA